MTKKKNPHRGSALDKLLKDDGVLEEFQAAAIKEVIAWQLQQEMKTKNLSKTAMAARMKTSRAQLNRLLDPKDGNVTIQTLQRAAAILGREIRVELV
jgi:DNA-binding Xre family transcriptional regulator